MAAGLWRAFGRRRPVAPRPSGPRGRGEDDEPPARETVQARVAVERITPAGEALDALAAEAFSGAAGRARVAPLLARFDEQIGGLVPDDPDFALLQVARMDWALCDVPATPDAAPGDTWAWRALRGHEQVPLRAAAARSIVGLFEVYPGEPTWVRDRISGVVARLFDTVGPFGRVDDEGPSALWELRLVPDAAGAFHVARAPIDYPLELLETLEELEARRFEPQPWPALQDLRRARLRYLRAGKRTPISRMLRWR
ncbi:hypothetical protein ENSA5_48970 [Enhygromyxa salina]|uniref:Uncharacterized protein n=1 Tax=Enhygromyxa salina TaxID=215803 RepID=A0A2S9XHX0_9BACT|nr:hypothetical protein [Enhygromyxa salina]PRP92479.1 hypothetical protein ENSA5_48970 [Enhygromyxa salina]